MKQIFFATLFCASMAFAADTQTTKIHNQYSSLRALGMGNAFTAVADDYSLIFYNPAGFANKKYNEVQFTLVGAGVASKTLALMKDIDDASKTSGTDEQKADAMSAALEPYYGKALGGKVQALEMFWIRKNWGVAILPVNLTIDMSINRQVGPAIDLDVKGDTTIAYGYGADYNKEWSWGVTAKGIHRVSVDQSVSALELASNPNVLDKSRFKEGIAVDADLGVMWTPNWFVKNKAKKQEAKTSTTTPAPADNVAPAPIAETADAKKASADKKDAKKKAKTDERKPNQEDTKVAETKSETLNTDKTPITSEVKPNEPTVTPEMPKAPEAAKTADADEKKTFIEKQAEENAPDENYPLTLGLTLRNVLGGNFTKSTMVNKDATDKPESMFRTIDVGSQYEITKWGGLTVRTMLDFRDLLHPTVTLNKSLHAGVELDFSPSGWFKTQLRAGVNQMYYTAGATLLLGVVNIDAVTYGEEVGTSSTKLENRVFAAKLGFNF